MSASPHRASWLFVPGSRPERFEKAARTRADEVILDLEDAVAIELKGRARAAIERYLSDGGEAWVRINGLGTPWHDEDVAALSSMPGLRGVVVPKAQAPDELTTLKARLAENVMLLALIETALGVQNVMSIASCLAVTRLAFGSIDLALDLDAENSFTALAYARGALVMASRAAGLAAPIDGVTVEIEDSSVVAKDADCGRRLGFGGKLCIHPKQVPVVNDAFVVSPEELDWARLVLAKAPEGVAAFAVDGRMIDRPLLERAKRLIDRAESQRRGA